MMPRKNCVSRKKKNKDDEEIDLTKILGVDKYGDNQ
jgi:hypothetical protein